MTYLMLPKVTYATRGLLSRMKNNFIVRRWQSKQVLDGHVVFLLKAHERPPLVAVPGVRLAFR